MDAVVVGCGIAGLTCAIRLREAGYDARIVTQALPLDTTSAVAAAVWYPYKAYPEHRVLGWGAHTLGVLYDHAANPESGVTLKPLIELFDHAVGDPWWKAAVRRFRRAAPAELRPGYVDGYAVEVPVVEAPVYLRYLTAWFRRLGGVVEHVPEGVASLASLRHEGRLVVNCTGLGARLLAEDPAVFPVRGQVVRVINPGLEACVIEDYGPLAMTYIIPRSRDCILGGTAEEHAWALEPDPAVTQDILRKACLLEPRLREADVLDVRVGLRPARPAVRLEVEEAASRAPVIHNYGHGGAGFTLAWGCAEEVLALARACA